MDTANYYGMAERYWGLANTQTLKPSAQVWIDGVKAERAATTVVNHAPTAAFTATGNALSMTADASASSDVDGDALSYAWSFGDGATAAGRTTSHSYATAGTYTVTLTVGDGTLSSSASKAVTATTPPPPPSFAATFAPKGNEWWVESAVSANQPIAKVEAKAGSGSWILLAKQDWGTYAKSFNVPKGTPVTFRATAADGSTATSETKPWLGPAPTSTTTTTTAPAFKATFTPKAQTNNWWVESAVSANQPIAKVEAKVNSGAYTVLPKTDWGTYAKSISAPDGAKVTFRATSPSGATSTSVAYTWG
jgi:PKD repeat protein